jgi:NAD(P)-dependent dehydrogenase (short-subunit alcohol dehydrogenase family)
VIQVVVIVGGGDGLGRVTAQLVGSWPESADGAANWLQHVTDEDDHRDDPYPATP